MGSVSDILFGGIFVNATGSTITDLMFGYTGEQWRLGNSTDDGLLFQYQIGVTNITDGNWLSLSSLDFAPIFTNGTTTGAALNGDLAANQRRMNGTLSGLNLLAGQNFGFRWADTNSTGSDQGLGVDNLTITSTVAGAVPEPTIWVMMLLGFGGIGFAMRRRTKVRADVSFA